MTIDLVNLCEVSSGKFRTLCSRGASVLGGGHHFKLPLRVEPVQYSKWNLIA